MATKGHTGEYMFGSKAAAIKVAEKSNDTVTGVEYDDVLIKGKDEQKVKEFICNARAAK